MSGYAWPSGYPWQDRLAALDAAPVTHTRQPAAPTWDGGDHYGAHTCTAGLVAPAAPV